MPYAYTIRAHVLDTVHSEQRRSGAASLDILERRTGLTRQQVATALYGLTESGVLTRHLEDCTPLYTVTR